MYSHGYGFGGPSCFSTCPPIGYGHSGIGYGGFGYGSAIILVLFILLVIIIGSRIIV